MFAICEAFCFSFDTFKAFGCRLQTYATMVLWCVVVLGLLCIVNEVEHHGTLFHLK